MHSYYYEETNTFFFSSKLYKIFYFIMFSSNIDINNELIQYPYNEAIEIYVNMNSHIYY